MLADTVGYAAIPLGVALGIDRTSGWITLAVLLGVLWVNAISWTYLAAVLEKRGAGAATSGELTTVTMPPALVEGTETIVCYSAFVVFPGAAPWLFSAMAAPGRVQRGPTPRLGFPPPAGPAAARAGRGRSAEIVGIGRAPRVVPQP